MLLFEIILKWNVFHVPASSPSLKRKQQRLGKPLSMKKKICQCVMMKFFTVQLVIYLMLDHQLGLAPSILRLGAISQLHV